MCKYSRQRTPCPLADAARQYPDAIAFFAPGKTLSYAELDQVEQDYCQYLQSQGVKPGERIVFDATPSLNCCIFLWAIARLNAVACPLNPALPAENRDRLLALLQPHWIATCRVGEAAGSPSFEIRNIVKQGLSQANEVRPDSPCFTMVMTSGSSGQPRAVVHSLENHYQAALAANRNMSLFSGDRWLLSLPLFHVSGIAILFRCALAGATVVIPDKNVSLEASLATSQATHVSLVPTQLYRLLASDKGRKVLGGMKGVLLGGAPASSALIQRAYDAGVPLVRSYGMTETSAQLCATPPGASLEELHTSGYPLTPGSMRIGENNGIEVCSPALFQGYFIENDKLELPLTNDGWFCTGDTGYLDAAGRLHVMGRADAMFISGGENIQPEEIEAALCVLPGVQRALVVAVDHEEYGMVPAAFVEMKGRAEFDGAVLRKIVETQLPRFKVPRYFFNWPGELTSGMKADRKVFTEKARQRVLKEN